MVIVHCCELDQSETWGVGTQKLNYLTILNAKLVVFFGVTEGIYVVSNG